MKIQLKIISFFFFGIFAFTGCGDNRLEKDVKPMANAMCKFIEIQNNLRDAIKANDSMNILKFSDDKDRMKEEMIKLNQEFQAKYGDLIQDQEFGKKFKKEITKLLIDCPYISAEDREKMLHPPIETSIDGIYSYEDREVYLEIVINGDSWNGKTMIITGFGSEYDNQKSTYESGTISGNDLYESRGIVKIGYIKGNAITTSMGRKTVTLRKK